MALALVATASCNKVKWQEVETPYATLIEQKNGRTLGYDKASGVQILYDKGYAFKDLNRNGKIDPYEDWRKPMRERAEDLASQLSIDEIAGLMLYSIHQAVPSDPNSYWGSYYNGKPLDESGLPHSAISDKQKKFLGEDNLRAILVVRVESPKIAAEWNNSLQSYAESLPFGIPVNISSDPRHETEARAEFNAGSGGQISLWPCSIGMAATFDPELVREFGQIEAREYRAMGISTALGPQIDLATEPRWFRFYGTFGEDHALAADMSRAVVDGMQTSFGDAEIEDGWGFHSINAMTKHWPGGGAGEGGRDAHYSFGKFSVYPGGNFEEHLIPFTEGALALDGKTKQTSAIMPYYTISYGIDPSGQNVGNGYSAYIVNDMLRGEYGYDGVVCTDWGVTHDYHKVEDSEGKCWGIETISEAERHYKAIKAGVDQFGGNNEKAPVLEAYKMWVAEFGEESARERFELSATRLLMNMFRLGLFDNPYVDPAEAEALVGCPEYMEKGYNAQLKSAILLKNHDAALPQKEGRKVYVPKLHYTKSQGFFGAATLEDRWDYPVDTAQIAKYYKVVTDPNEADFALVFINEPEGGHGYSVEDRNAGGNGYVPISLQYSDYTAEYARDPSVAGGDPFESFTNRSFKGKSVKTNNKEDLDIVIATKKLMGDKPVVVAVSALRPFVPEFEPYSDAILLTLCLQNQVVLDLSTGKYEPSGLLPMQMPADMKTVEEQNEDVPLDMVCWRDADGNVYDFAFGLNWSGRIKDARTEKYGHASPIYGQFLDDQIGNITPKGWIKEYLERQRTGLTGHPEAMSYPYNTCLWAGEIKRNNTEYGSEWWRYEQTAYYTDGLIRLGYLLDDKSMSDKAVEGIKYTFEHKDSTGRLAHNQFEYTSMWAFSVFFRAIKAYCEKTGDFSMLEELDKHYSTFPLEEVEIWRNIVSLEGMLWTYDHNRDPWLLRRSETAWNSGKFGDLTPEACALDTIPFMHGVTCMEELKLPVLLYMHTGNEHYMDLARNVIKNIDKDHILPDGVPVSNEPLTGNKNVISSHETCDIADYSWTLGYFLMATGEGEWADRIERATFNAAPGAITKDFKAMQYFSSVNQTICTGTSNHNWFAQGRTWMGYRTAHETECCIGEVNRIMPNYASRMWMRGRNGEVVAALYGPSEYEFDIDGNKVKIEENTYYPFEEDINFKFKMDKKAELSFMLRIPEWSEGATVKVNGKEVPCEKGKFLTIKRTFKSGDKVSVHLPMELKLNHFQDQGVYVDRGPILYTYAVPEDRQVDTTKYDYLYGKESADTSFKSWNIYPAGPWNYAVAGEPYDLKVNTQLIESTYPFELGNPTITVQIPVKEIEWELWENRYTRQIPKGDQIKVTKDSLQTITLIPYGATELRVTVFPEVK